MLFLIWYWNLVLILMWYLILRIIHFFILIRHWCLVLRLFHRCQSGILEGRVVYYEQISFANKYIYRIIVSFSFCHKNINIMHGTDIFGHMGEYKTLYRIRLQLFWSKYVLILKNGSRNVIIVYLHIDEDDVVESWFFLGRLVLPSLYFMWIYGCYVIILVLIIIWLLSMLCAVRVSV